MGELDTIILRVADVGEKIGSNSTLANAIRYARAAFHSAEIILFNHPISHRATLNSLLASLRKAGLMGNGIRQRDLVMPPIALDGYHAYSKSDVKGRLDSDLEWFYKRSGNRYARLGNIISAGSTVCELDYLEKKVVFRYGASHELEPLLKQRGFQVSYKENHKL